MYGENKKGPIYPCFVSGWILYIQAKLWKAILRIKSNCRSEFGIIFLIN